MPDAIAASPVELCEAAKHAEVGADALYLAWVLALKNLGGADSITDGLAQAAITARAAAKLLAPYRPASETEQRSATSQRDDNVTAKGFNPGTEPETERALKGRNTLHGPESATDPHAPEARP